MKRAVLALSTMALGSAGATAGLAACDGVLGIEKATWAQDASPDASGPMDRCTVYCRTVNANCTGVSPLHNQEYLATDPAANIDVCLAMCQYIADPPDSSYPFPGPDPPNEDTLGCRLWHAQRAGTANPETHCRHAGPLGSELCGANPCRAFCNFDLSYCAEQSNVPVYGNSQATCLADCAGDAGFPYISGTSAGDLIDQNHNAYQSGNTLNCRLWHLETAIQKNLPVVHCPHTDEQSSQCK
jgi:hypothetical protein